MNGRVDTERILDAFLAPEADRLPDRVIDATLDQLARTRQRRAMRVPWRFLTMPASSRATAIAAVVLVAVVGAGALIYLNSTATGGVGGQPATSTPSPTVAPSPATSAVAPGIAAWREYTSRVYGFQFGYPKDWTAYAATRGWKASDATAADWPYADAFSNPEQTDGDSIGLWVFQVPAGDGANLASVTGLKAWAQSYCKMTATQRPGGAIACNGFTARAKPMCREVGGDVCLAALVVPDSDGVTAFFGDGKPDTVRVVSIGRPDDFPAAARYGGSIQLLTSILSTMGVHTPVNGQAPAE